MATPQKRRTSRVRVTLDGVQYRFALSPTGDLTIRRKGAWAPLALLPAAWLVDYSTRLAKGSLELR